jgi:hypothetical protein
MSGEFVCSKCGGKVTQQLFGEETGRHELSWCCTSCTTCFGPPWLEKQWEYRLAATLDPGLDPWPDEAQRNATSMTIPAVASVASRQPTSNVVRRFIMAVLQGTTAGIVGAIWMLVVLWFLLLG